jgi:hypothetical protein
MLSHQNWENGMPLKFFPGSATKPSLLRFAFPYCYFTYFGPADVCHGS